MNVGTRVAIAGLLFALMQTTTSYADTAQVGATIQPPALPSPASVGEATKSAPALPASPVQGAPDFIAIRAAAMDRLRESAKGGDDAAAFALASQLLSGATNNDRITEGLTWLRQASDAGVAEARVKLAAIVGSGQFGAPLDRDGAIKLLQSAVDAGDINALTPLAQLLLATEFDPVNRARALALLDKGAQAGDIGASTALGELYASGAGVALDAKKALSYFDVGLVAGNAAAALDAADLLRNGSVGLPADPAASLAILNELYARGNLNAARQIADMYLNGNGVPANTQTTVDLLTTLASAGDAASLVALADLYSSGEFLPIDAEQAIGLYQRAISLGNKSAALRLANLYLQGLGDLAPDSAKAMKIFEAALATGGPQAKRAVALALLQGDPTILDPTRGLELLKQAANEGDATAAKQLGRIYSDNSLVIADYALTKQYFDSAIASGDFTAVVDLAHALATGPLAAEHHGEAQTLLKTAIDSHVPGAASEMARLQLAGSFSGGGVQDVLGGLLEAARGGDIDAARMLIHLYRDGSGLVLQRNRKAAESTLTELSSLLGPEVSAVERIGLKAGDGFTVPVYEAINSDLESLPPSSRVRILRQLRTSNTRAFVYIVQKHLAAAGMYSGAMEGALDNLTIRAIMQACTAAGALQQCAQGPLTPGAVKALTTYLYAPKPDAT